MEALSRARCRDRERGRCRRPGPRALAADVAPPGGSVLRAGRCRRGETHCRRRAGDGTGRGGLALADSGRDGAEPKSTLPRPRASGHGNSGGRFSAASACRSSLRVGSTPAWPRPGPRRFWAQAAAREASRSAQSEIVRARARAPSQRPPASKRSGRRRPRRARPARSSRRATKKGPPGWLDLLEARAAELRGATGAAAAAARLGSVAEANLRLALGLPPEGDAGMTRSLRALALAALAATACAKKPDAAPATRRARALDREGGATRRGRPGRVRRDRGEPQRGRAGRAGSRRRWWRSLRCPVGRCAPARCSVRPRGARVRLRRRQRSGGRGCPPPSAAWSARTGTGLGFERLAGRGAAAPVELERARQEETAAAAGLASAEALSSHAQTDRSRSGPRRLRSTRSSWRRLLSARRSRGPGTPARPAGLRARRCRVEASPGEQEASRLAAGDEWWSSSSGGKRLKGRVAEIVAAVDPATRRRLVRVRSPSRRRAGDRNVRAPDPARAQSAEAHRSREGGRRARRSRARLVDRRGRGRVAALREQRARLPAMASSRSDRGWPPATALVMDPPADLEAGTRVGEPVTLDSQGLAPGAGATARARRAPRAARSSTPSSRRSSWSRRCCSVRSPCGSCRARKSRRSSCRWSTSSCDMPGASASEVEERVTKPWKSCCGRSPASSTSTRLRARAARLLIVRFLVGEDEERALVRLNRSSPRNLDLIPAGASHAAGQAALDRRRADPGADALEQALRATSSCAARGRAAMSRSSETAARSRRSR